jgi:hypothetical protein
MVSKDYLKSFSRFLDEASGRELVARINLVEEQIGRLRMSRSEPHRALVADMQFLLRRMREEQAAREEVTASEKARAAG